MKKLLPVVIPYYKAEAELRKCLAALSNQHYRPVEVFIRDNSVDNILFTAAVNEGLLKYCCRDDVDFILVLNQDAYVQEQTLDCLVSFMESAHDCGIACPVQFYERNGAIRVYWGGSYRAVPGGVHRCDPLPTYTSNFETFWANGAAMLLRTSMIREIGLLDKNMRFIASDSDYSFTARSRGWKVMVVGDARVNHGGGESMAPTNQFIRSVMSQDMIYFLKKWLSGDLYRSLAFEGKDMTPQYIQSLLAAAT